MIDYSKFEIIVSCNHVTSVCVNINGKMQEVDIDDITDTGLLEKVRKLKIWLRIYPIGYYVFDSQEYEDYKKFMENKRYLLDTGCIVNPLWEKLSEREIAFHNRKARAISSK